MFLLMIALLGAPPEMRPGQTGYVQALHKGIDALLSRQYSQANRVSEIDTDYERDQAIRTGQAFEVLHNTQVTVVSERGAFFQVRISERTHDGPAVGTTGWIPRDQVYHSRSLRRHTR